MTLGGSISASRHTARVLDLLDRLGPFVAILIMAGLALRFHQFNRPCEWDDVYVRAAQVLASGGQVYDEVPTYTYPPFMAWLALPFAALGVVAGRILWFAVNVACLVGMVHLAWRWVYPRQLTAEAPASQRLERWAVFAFGLFLGGRALTISILHHQTDLVFGLLVFAGIDQWIKGRALVAAVGFGLAAAMKCTPLLWLVFFLWSGPRPAALVVGLTAIAANLLPSLTHPGTEGTWLGAWLNQVLLNVMRPGSFPGQWNVDVMTNQSLAGSVYAWLTTTWSWDASGFQPLPRAIPLASPLVAKLLVYGTGLTLLIGSLRWWPWRRLTRETRAPIGILNVEPTDDPRSGLEPVLQASMVLMLMLLLSPMSHKTHFGLLLVPGFALGRLWLTQPTRGSYLALAALAVLQIGSLRLWSMSLGHWASWHGAQMLSTLVMLLACWHGLAQLRAWPTLHMGPAVPTRTVGRETSARPTAPTRRAA